MLTRAQQLILVAQAGRAPSAHNIQPARWHFKGDRVALLEDPGRWLPVGDPTGRDNQIALGMAWEGMAMALSTIGVGLARPAVRPLPYPCTSPGLRIAATATMAAGAHTDPLAVQVDQRHAYRGKFRGASPSQRTALAQCVAAHAAHVMPASEHSSAGIARWYDEAAAAAFAMPGFADELYRWLRLSPDHPQWRRDGLSAPCLALSRWEAWGASMALRPGVVRWLSALSLTGMLAGESAKIRSAAGIVLIHASPEVSNFDLGRHWYRFWLAMTAHGLAGVPMSALADSPGHAALLAESQRLPRGNRLVNVMRCGPAPAGVAQSARLPAAELLVDDASWPAEA
ncbi:conserved protein of unknown function [Cupriavidus taiwanensis]|uniref:Nitroreductase domain-containing protein n=1 Tax=Cupriavidus taiwanensis TaxID=164546 RepID=A0A375I6J0_9BURK|nr:hypothetical protein [Cupriavidus taiwanensis]SPK70237.1 conserved hypothetical protein [Cupriavidus taiwanensis]SPK72279.1 conserved protein of unknown function [Cupriavidus taiwanensis]